VTALSLVSVPISPRQQCYLAFISEFNVQMLYLPGLKNTVADFLPCPSPTPLPPASTETVAASAGQIQWILKLWQPSKTAAQKRLSPRGTQCLVGDVSTGVFHPIVPQKFRK
jgi:hypothetical protein